MQFYEAAVLASDGAKPNWDLKARLKAASES
jgi:hypothetical protein